MLPKFISLLALFALLHPLINARYTLDACSTDSDCASRRVCLQFRSIADIGPCEPAGENCICTEIDEVGLPNFRSCRFDDECLEGDTCQSAGNTRTTNCISKCQETGANNCPDKSKGPKPTKTPKPASSPKTTGTRLTRDCCQKASDCKSPRECVAVGTALRKCKPGESCVCVPTKDPKCEDNGDCEEGEECFDGSGDQPGFEGSSRCVSTCSILKDSNPGKYESMCESCSVPRPSPYPTLSPGPRESPAPETPTLYGCDSEGVTNPRSNPTTIGDRLRARCCRLSMIGCRGKGDRCAFKNARGNPVLCGKRLKCVIKRFRSLMGTSAIIGTCKKVRKVQRCRIRLCSMKGQTGACRVSGFVTTCGVWARRPDGGPTPDCRFRCNNRTRKRFRGSDGRLYSACGLRRKSCRTGFSVFKLY